MNENPFVLIDRLAETHSLSVSEYQTLVLSETETLRTYAAQKADKIREFEKSRLAEQPWLANTI